MVDQRASIYVNAVNILVSLYDFSLDLRSQSPKLDQSGKILELQSQPLVEVTDEIVVRMSPQHAKALAAVLVKHVKEYEKRFNMNLPLPDDIKSLWEESVIKEN